MRKLFAAFIGAVFLASFSAALASDRGTPPEAKALAEKAAAHLKEVGKEQAFADFNDPKGKFVDRDLYIFVEDMTATNLAHGANKALIGKSLYDLKDADGKLLGRNFVEVAKTKGAGWVNYKWPNPVTKKIEEKETYIIRVDDVFVGCGAYKS